jgi:hypothetical protein
MNNYKSISFGGQVLPNLKSLSYLRTLIRKNKRKEGEYTCVTPSGSTHIITFASTSYSAKGYGTKPGRGSKRKRNPYAVFNVKQVNFKVK